VAHGGAIGLRHCVAAVARLALVASARRHARARWRARRAGA
jgi:hypothetical protein